MDIRPGEIVIFESKDGSAQISVKLEKETIWLSQKQMSELFEKDSDTIGFHLKNIYESGELEQKATTAQYSLVQKEGKEVRRIAERNRKKKN